VYGLTPFNVMTHLLVHLVKEITIEEVIEFCIDFVDSIDSIGVPISRQSLSIQFTEVACMHD
jgi:hypothetical protein